MALVTLRTELAVVHVVCHVTPAASGWHIGGVRCRISMTIDTAKTFMSAIETKIRVQIMIECSDQPVIAAMAGFTLLAETTLVRIVIAVTARAVRRRIVKSIARMAGAASDCSVQAG